MRIIFLKKECGIFDSIRFRYKLSPCIVKNLLITWKLLKNLLSKVCKWSYPTYKERPYLSVTNHDKTCEVDLCCQNRSRLQLFDPTLRFPKRYIREWFLILCYIVYLHSLPTSISIDLLCMHKSINNWQNISGKSIRRYDLSGYSRIIARIYDQDSQVLALRYMFSWICDRLQEHLLLYKVNELILQKRQMLVRTILRPENSRLYEWCIYKLD